MSYIDKKDVINIILPRLNSATPGSLEYQHLYSILKEVEGEIPKSNSVLSNDKLLSERYLADTYMEYVKAITNINNQQERIQSIVQKALDNGIEISDISNHFVYRKDHGLFYRNSVQSSYFGVQIKIDPPSFSETIDGLLKQDYSYQNTAHLFVQLTNDATGFLKNLPKLEEQIDLAIGDKHWKYNKQQDAEIESPEVKNSSFKEYLSKLEDVFKKNGIQRCYCSDNFKDDTTNHLYIVSLPGAKFSKEFYDVLSERCNNYKISSFTDRNVDMDWYTLYASDLGLNYGHIDLSGDKEDVDKSDPDEYEL